MSSRLRARLARIERGYTPGVCPMCRGRGTLVYVIGDEPPPDRRCAVCGLGPGLVYVVRVVPSRRGPGAGAAPRGPADPCQ